MIMTDMAAPIETEPHYEAFRSHNDPTLSLIVSANDGYDRVPLEIRQRGPWLLVDRGPIGQLNLEIRRELDARGWWFAQLSCCLPS
jgi:hypothetical protein